MFHSSKCYIALLFAMSTSFALANDRLPRKGVPLSIPLKMTESGKLGHDRIMGPINADPSGSPPPQLYNLQYVWDGQYLRVRSAKVDKSKWSERERAKDNWYVTGDVLAHPPRVFLAKEPTKASRWEFVPADTPQRRSYYIKNESSNGRAAWLDIVDTGECYSVGSDSAGYRDVKVYMATLSTESKRAFSVVDIEHDGGK